MTFPTRALVVGILGATLVSGCSLSSSNDDSRPSVTPLPTMASGSIVDVGVVHGSEVAWDDADAKKETSGIPSGTLILGVINDFARAQLSPLFLSGEYQNESASALADTYQPVVGEALLNDLRGVDPAELEDSYLAMSLGAFLSTASGDVSAATYCTSKSTELSDCLSDDVVISDVNVYDAVSGSNQVQVSFTVATTRLVVVDSQGATSSIEFQDSIWVNTSTGKVESAQCAFSFGEIKPL